jgi:hypothetical protein
MSATRTLFALLVIASATASAAPRFKDFPATAYTGQAAGVQLHGAKSRMYATRLRLGSREPVNFAGHYILTTWGCGASCTMGAAIDARTGAVTWFPYTVCCWDLDVDEAIEYRLDSRLFITHGSLDEKGAGSAVHYYHFDGGRFVPLRVAR